MKSAQVNVNRIERTASVAIGGVLLMRSVRRFSFGRMLMALAGADLLYRGLTGHSYLFQAFDVSTVRGRQHRPAGAPADAAEMAQFITIGKSADELYRSWHEPDNVRQVWAHFAEVTPIGEKRAHWSVRNPLGRRLQWDAEIIAEEPGHYVRWQSLAGADVPNEGEVRFQPAPGNWGTEVSLRFRFDPPGGVLGDAAVKLLGVVPRLVVQRALRRFKSLVETGEIPTLEHNPSARAA